MNSVKLTHKKLPLKIHLKKPDTKKPPTTAPKSGTTTPPATDPASPLTKKVLNPEYAVFGWHPYWMDGSFKMYDFNLLSHVAYFSYEVDPSTGDAKTIHDWLTTPMIDSARAENPACKILLTITCFGNDNSTFLKSSTAQTNLITSVIELLDQRKANGVNIDFEGIPAGLGNAYSMFIGQFALALHEKGYILTIAIPAVDRNSIYDIESLNTYVDLYILMGYGYYGSFSSKPGPVSPLLSSDQWGTASISKSVQYYMSQSIEKDKLLIGLPYYGAFWQSQASSQGTDSLTFLEYLTYASYMEQVGVEGQFDSLSISSFSDQEKEDIFHHYWGEDTSSLSGKFDWVIKNQLKGIGIWALGYDNGRHELWNLLGEKFGVDSIVSPTDTSKQHASDTTHTSSGGSGGKDADKPSKFEQAVQFFNTYTYSILFAFLVLFICAMTGFLSLYFNDETVALLKEKKLYYPGLILSALIVNLIVGLSVYLTYGVPPIIIFFFSLLFWTLVVLTYYFVYMALHEKEIP